jgi:hypothetical protein
MKHVIFLFSILDFHANIYFQYGAGKISVLGSVHMFSDQYLDKEENSKIMVSAEDS